MHEYVMHTVHSCLEIEDELIDRSARQLEVMRCLSIAPHIFFIRSLKLASSRTTRKWLFLLHTPPLNFALAEARLSSALGDDISIMACQPLTAAA